MALTEPESCILFIVFYSFSTNSPPPSCALAATAFGWATGTTGGAGGVEAIPSSPQQLKQWLEDSTPLVIILDKTYDFTDTEGSATGPGCKPWSCSPNVQFALNGPDWCASTPTKATFTYKVAPTVPIQLGSNKTLRGKEVQAGCLRILGATNIIIQNVRFSDMNQQYVWGGDALTLHGGSKIWIDHNYFKDVGRQFIVSEGFNPTTQVTISNNYFDGRAPFCDGDTMTFAYNYVYHASGRAPKVGGTDGLAQTVHMYNNYFHDISGHALDAAVGSRVLFEGNYIESVKTPTLGDPKGALFAPTSASMNAQCASAIGRNCVSNTLVSSGSLINAAKSGVLGDFKKSFVTSNKVMDASAVKSYVLANAGLGKI
ncbi:Pectate lyase [Rhizoctonia solani]|uniref:pectin lyase n=1 Tax=Rhizoctonia solani TaxID=456999 RepID=A0A8H7LIP5_9AGAM|nr:Pectate lyase [Rhizoctonia solani]